MAATTATDSTNAPHVVIVAGARTPMGRLLGSLEGLLRRRARRLRDQGRARAAPASRPTRSTT